MADKAPASKNYKDIAQGFGVCTLAVIFLYLMSGMNAVSLREMPLSVLMTVFTTACVYYVTRAFVSTSRKFLSLVSAVPVFAIYMLIFTLSFKAVNRATLSCISIMENVMLWGGLGTILVCVTVLIAAHKFEAKDAVTAVLCAGFVLRAVMVVFTPLNFWQHDVSNFSEDQAGFHDTYILYIYNNMALPSGDVRDLGQFYHPPLHYLLSALFLKIHTLLPTRFAGNINGLKFLPMLWTSYFILFAKKTLEWFKIEGKALAISLALIVFCPQMIFLAIQVNNDALALMLFAASFFLALKWYSKPELATVLFLAIAIGCAMMTKLSMGFVALPVAWLFLAKLVKTVKEPVESKAQKAAHKGRIKDLIKQFAVFAVTVFPLGLWFPLKNLITYGTPITYVFEIDSSAGQDVWMYSAWQRLFAPSKELLRAPFLQEGGSLNDFNIPLAIVKTGLFDERRFTDPYLVFVAKVLVILAFVLVLIVSVCAVYGACKRIKESGKSPENIALWILAAALILPEILFCFKHPVVCTQSFRYIVPVLIPAAFWCGSIVKMQGGASKAMSKAITAVTVLFVIAVIMFYGVFAQYSGPWEALIR